MEPTRSRPPWWQIIAIGSNPKVTIIRLFITVIIAVVVFRWTLVPIQVKGISMLPTYKDGQALYVNRWSLRRRPPERGDVLGIRMAGNHALLLKRVIAMPGERVAIRNGQVYVNGETLDEPYVKERMKWNWPTDSPDRLVGPDEFLVIGDNRGMPMDLHEWGLVEKDRIVGRVNP